MTLVDFQFSIRAVGEWLLAAASSAGQDFDILSASFHDVHAVKQTMP